MEGDKKIRRCAIYTRKSSEEGLEQDFNSLHAQREACEAFVRSQAGEGWRLIRAAYDDGGLSGATTERPGLQRLMADIEKGLVDAVVVYKVDRLTRSLADFAKLVELFDARGVSFIAVTQQFNTATSMGRLTLNVLLSFAQFERELTGERIRDKIAASKRKGMWMGGLAPLGYDVRERQLVINEAEAATVRQIFRRYGELKNVRLLKAELDRDGVRSKRRVAPNGTESGGHLFSRGGLYNLLNNPIYFGEIRHKGVCYPGQHAAIIDRSTWEQTARLLRDRPTRRGASGPHITSPLTSKIFDEQGERLTPSATAKGDRRYRYYVSASLMKGATHGARRGWRLPAPEIERVVAAAVRQMLEDRASIARAAEEAGVSDRLSSIFESAVVWSRRLGPESRLGSEAAPLIDRVELREDGLRLLIGLPIARAEAQSHNGSRLTIERVVPMQIRRRGIELRMVIDGGGGRTSRPDPALLKAIARARCWFEELISGRRASLLEIGQKAKVGKQYVSRLLPLAFLAPEIVGQIVEGRQPPQLTAQALLNGQIRISPHWEAQRKALGLAPAG